MNNIDPVHEPFDYGPESHKSESELYYSLALEEVRKKQDVASRTDAMLASEGLEGSRRMLIYEDSATGGLPLAHTRFGLQPQVRGKVIEGAEQLIIRIPLVPAVTASEALKAQLGRNRPTLLQGVRIPTKDIAIEVLSGSAVTQRFLVTPEGLHAYDDPADVTEALSELQNGERLLEVIQHQGTAEAQARFDNEGMSLGGLVSALTMYELSPQENTLPGRNNVA